jgi:hypothetical protein
LRGEGLPRALNYLGVVIGLLWAVPGLVMLNGVFELSQIAWFVWLEIILLRICPCVSAVRMIME